MSQRKTRQRHGRSNGRTRIVTASALGWVLAGAPMSGNARPLLEAGAKPSAVAAWSESGGVITLELAAGFEAGAVAKAMASALRGPAIKVEPQGKVVLVRGMALPELLAALEKIDAGSEDGDDIEKMIINLREGEADEGSGSSIRATQASDFSEVFTDESRAILAKVVSVKREQFPLVVVKLQVSKASKSHPSLKQGMRFAVLPRVRSRNGVVDVEDKLSKLNVGAWYAQPGDLVKVKLESDPRDGVWVAEAFERQPAR